MKKFYLFNWIFLFMGLISFTTFGQTTIFNAAGNSSIEGWTYTNNVTTNQIQQSSYWLIDAGNPSDIITSSNYIGNYTDVNLKFEYATYGSGSNPVLKIEYSTDNGDTFTLLGTNNKATSSTFVNENSVVPNFSTSIMFRFSNENLSGKGVRLKNIVLTGNQPINTPPTVSSKTITGTYGVLLTDGEISATNNPTSWTQTGTLPLGITFDNGVFSGTPEQAGTFTTQVAATNQYGTSDPANITFEIAKGNQTVSHTFANLSQNQGTTFSDLPTQTDQGLNIVYTSADNSIVSTNGNTLSFDGIGSTTITVTAVGDNNFNDYTTTFNVSSKDPNIVTYNGEGTFVKVTNLSDVTDGYYVVTNEKDEYLMTNTFTTFLASSDANVSNGEIVNPSVDNVWKLESDMTSYTIYNEVLEKYVGWTSGNSVALSSTLADNYKWDLSYADNKFTVNNVATPTRQLSYNSGSPRFAAYGNANQEELQLYKLVSSNSTTWDGTAWSNGTPDLTKEVILHATPTESFSAKKLTIERDMIIPAGITITVENEVVNENEVTFRFSHGAYLIQNNNSAVNVGPAMFDRSSTPIYRLENMTWSSPVIGQNIFEISPKTLTNRFTRFNESTNDWDANVTSTDTFQAGELIAFRAPNDYNNYGEGDAQVFESSFRGQLFNGEVTIPVTKTSKGNNAVGNPYASPLSLDALIAANTSVGVNSVYVWTHSKPIVNGAYQGSNWVIYNGTGWNDNSVTSQNIDIAQGFIVKVANAGNLVLNNAMRTSANGPVYYKEQKDRYWLSLSNNQGKINSSLIGYVNGSTNKFDQNFDAHPFDNNNEGLYSVLNNDLFVIQGRGDFNNEDSFDLTFNVKKAGTYQINLEKFEGVFENQNIYLVDRKLDKVFNLSELKSYSFDTEVGEINDRFSINYQNKTLSTNDLSKKGLVVYAQNKQITISSKESIKSIKLVDISGRQLQNIQNINIKNYVINLNVNPQVVVVVVENTNGTTESRKVILK
ncbi:Ig domain-containing protein [Empedobacter falsenii]|uniref:Ig domain-containing protein n=1 Tax=Empedobacter falsenii TaxID=343874 RepID=UPI001C8EA720|nr:Ig domain-containing protein [Empedobacter falsenii]MBY0068105.1 Ig domain-containing protein [Empedobacter falsenii]